MGPLSVSPMGFGTWAWGNQLLWGYEESMDAELQQIFNLAVENGINLFDTADSYGTGRFNGQSEKLLGKFIGESQGPISSLVHIYSSYYLSQNQFPTKWIAQFSYKEWFYSVIFDNICDSQYTRSLRRCLFEFNTHGRISILERVSVWP